MSFLLDKLGVPSPAQVLSQLGGGVSGLRQALTSTYSDLMTGMPTSMARNIMGTGNGPGAAPGPSTPVQSGQYGPSPASSNGIANGNGISLPGPAGNVSIPTPSLPPAPFTGAGPQASAPLSNSGLLGNLGNVLGSVTTGLRNLLGGGGPAQGPPGFAPGQANGSNVPSAPGVTPGLGTLPGNVVSSAANVGQAVTHLLSGGASPAPQTGSALIAGQTASAQLPTGPMQTPQASLQASTLPQPSSLPPQTTTAQGSQPPATQAQPQTAALTPQQLPAPPLQQAQPARADAAFAPPGTAASDRAAVPQQALPATQPSVPSTPQGAALLAAVPLATTAAQAPVAQQLAGNPQATGNPLAGNAALDAGSPARAELTGTGVYTAEGPGLRRRERMWVGAQQMGQWMLAMAQGRLHLVRPHDDDTPREVARAFQWLFWILAIVAYGCLGLVLVSYLLSVSELPAAPALRRWTGGFTFSGLLAAAGAWWLGRKLMRAARPPADPIRR